MKRRARVEIYEIRPEGGAPYVDDDQESKCRSRAPVHVRKTRNFLLNRPFQSMFILGVMFLCVNCLHRTANLITIKYTEMMGHRAARAREVKEMDIENPDKPVSYLRDGQVNEETKAAHQEPEPVVEKEADPVEAPKEPEPVEESKSEEEPAPKVSPEGVPLDADGNPDQCAGKMHFLSILVKAGKTMEEARKECEKLPLWSEVSYLYGEKPVILGMERCEAYREKLAKDFPKKLPPLKNIRIDGLFNAGTNALAQNMLLNLEDGKYHDPDNMDFDGPEYFQKHGIKVFAGWGKHTLISHPVSPKIQTQLPIVLVRDPYRWMKSMVS